MNTLAAVHVRNCSVCVLLLVLFALFTHKPVSLSQWSSKVKLCSMPQCVITVLWAILLKCTPNQWHNKPPDNSIYSLRPGNLNYRGGRGDSFARALSSALCLRVCVHMALMALSLQMTCRQANLPMPLRWPSWLEQSSAQIIKRFKVKAERLRNGRATPW